MNRQEKKRRKALFKIIEEKQRAEEIARMPFLKSDLKALLEFLNDLDTPCNHTLKKTEAFLDKSCLVKNTIIPWLKDYGGFCDCEVLNNVGDAWGDYVDFIWKYEECEKISKKKEQKHDKLVLACGISLAKVPSQWKLSFVEEASVAYWFFKFGKKGELSLSIFEKTLPRGNLELDSFWCQQWTNLTKFFPSQQFIVERALTTLISPIIFHSVTVSHPHSLPVYQWLYSPDKPNLYMLVKTNSIRQKNDFAEVASLLAKFIYGS